MLKTTFIESVAKCQYTIMKFSRQKIKKFAPAVISLALTVAVVLRADTVQCLEDV
jgi:hypothetical protein